MGAVPNPVLQPRLCRRLPSVTGVHSFAGSRSAQHARASCAISNDSFADACLTAAGKVRSCALLRGVEDWGHKPTGVAWRSFATPQAAIASVQAVGHFESLVDCTAPGASLDFRARARLVMCSVRRLSADRPDIACK